MAYVRKQRGKWRVEVEKAGVRKSATFLTKADAVSWGAMEEAAILKGERARFPLKTLADAFDRYKESHSSLKRGARAEELRMEALKRDFPELASKVISTIETPDLARWRDARLKKVTPGSVRRDANLLRNVFCVARDEWKWLDVSPFKGFKVPSDNAPRQRRVHWREVKAICRWLGYRTPDVGGKQAQVARAFLVGLRTGMRAGEILSLSDETVDLDKRVATIPHKMQYLTGRPRQVPLTRAGLRLLRPLAGRGAFFDVSSDSLDALFRKATTALLLKDLHFHDSRAEALTRLSRKVDVMTLARISGHKDLKILLETYYRESAEAIAARI